MALFETYGLQLESGCGLPLSQADYELAAFRLNLDLLDEGKEDNIGVGAEQHFINISHLFWGRNSAKPFVWTDQARFMLSKLVRHKVLTIIGHASSSKTCITSLWNLVLWLAEPDTTKCIVVSTEKTGAQNRIWGQLSEFFNVLPSVPGRLYASGIIVPIDPLGRVKYSKRHGIELIAGNENKERESATKIQGFKAGGLVPGRICLAVDEATGVAKGIFDSYFKNIAGNPRARFIALGNFNRKESPFGVLCEPVGGWETTEPEDQFWKTNEGYCIHLDGLQSDNWRLQRDEYPFLQSYTAVKRYYDLNLEQTPEFWEMVRAYPAPVGIGDLGVYDPAAISLYKADRRVADTAWVNTPQLWAGVDPAHTAEGGDNAYIVPVRTGLVQDGFYLLEALEPIQIPIDAQSSQPATNQVLDYLHIWRHRVGCDLQNIGYDGTNTAFIDMVRSDPRFGRMLHPVLFGGAGASDAITTKYKSEQQHLRNSEKYGNRVTEIWCQPLDFLYEGQLRGICGLLHSQVTKRKYDESIFRNGRVLQRVETKREMKKRTKGKSPDAADAYFICLATIIHRLSLRAGAPPLSREEKQERREKALRRGMVMPPRLKTVGRPAAKYTIQSMFGQTRPSRHQPEIPEGHIPKFIYKDGM